MSLRRELFSGRDASAETPRVGHGEIFLLASGVIGLLVLLTGVAMVYEPAAFILLGALVVAASLTGAFLGVGSRRS